MRQLYISLLLFNYKISDLPRSQTNKYFNAIASVRRHKQTHQSTYRNCGSSAKSSCAVDVSHTPISFDGVVQYAYYSWKPQPQIKCIKIPASSTHQASTKNLFSNVSKWGSVPLANILEMEITSSSFGILQLGIKFKILFNPSSYVFMIKCENKILTRYIILCCKSSWLF